MEISPIREVRAVSAASTSKENCEIPPPFDLNLEARMEDDAYRGDGRMPKRGLEEEDQEDAEERTVLADESDSETTVNFFA